MDDSKLHQAIAGRCRGSVAILGGMEGLEQRIRAAGSSVTELRSSANGDRFRTVVVAGALERAAAGDGATLLERGWSYVEPGGRMVVSVPNEDCCEHGEAIQEFDRRRLKKLLEPYGKPRLATEQPFRWLLMYIDKPKHGRPKRNRVRTARYRVTARLCRGRVIELGCGEGVLTKMVHDRGNQVVGVDISREKIARARELFPDIDFVQSDILQLSYGQEFDTAVLAEVLEHVPDAIGDRMLDSAWDLLRPGGRLVVSVPNEDCIPHPNHVREFDRRGLKRILRRYGSPRLITDQPYKWLLMYVNKPT